MAIRQDPTSERLTSRYQRLSAWLGSAYIAIGVISMLLAFHAGGLFVSLFVGIAITLVGTTRSIRLRSEQVLATHKSPDDVRKELESFESPLVTFHLALADEIREPSGDDGDPVAVFRDLLGFTSMKSTVTLTDDGSGTIRLQCGRGDTIHQTTDVTVEPDGYGSRLHVTVIIPKEPMLTLACLPIQDPIVRRFYEHHGYRVVSAETSIGLRFV